MGNDHNDTKRAVGQERDLDPNEMIAKTEKEVVAEAVKNAETLDAKLAAATEAVRSAGKAAEKEVVSEVVRGAETLDAKLAVASEVVRSGANNREQQKILKEAVDQASPEAREALRQMLLPGQKALDRIWQMVVGSFAFVLCASALALIGAVFVQTDQGLAQILLTVFTTVAGILAGFISGKAIGSAKG